MKIKIDKMILTMVANSMLAVMLILVDWFLLREVSELFTPILIVAMFVLAFPIIIIQYNKYRKKKELEEMFPVFLRDFVEVVRSGIPVTQAFKSVADNDYLSLSKYVKKISAQVDWGIPIDKVLLNFVKEVKSNVIGRVVSSVIESHRFGGNLADTFDALSNTSMEVEKLRAERRLYLQSQIMTGYVVFFVFLGVIIGLEKFLVPSLEETNVTSLGGLATGGAGLGLQYKELFRNLILIQGLFAGLSVGKMAEGAIIAGLKHSLFMMFVGGLIFTIVG